MLTASCVTRSASSPKASDARKAVEGRRPVGGRMGRPAGSSRARR